MVVFQSLASRFADTLDALPVGERRDTVACAVIEAGGQYPFQIPYRAAQEIQLHGTHAAGWTEDEAIKNWIDTAQRPPKGILATDGRPDCPYNGQGVAPGLETPEVPEPANCG